VIPGSFNQASYLANQHITAILRHPERLVAFETSNQPQFILQRLTDHLKARVAKTFAKALPSPQAEVLGGIVLGDKAIPVDRDTRQAFIQTGLVHVLAASGLNVGIIAGAVLWLLALSKLPYRVRIGIAMLAVAFYSLLTGLPPSIQRAATMLEIALFLKLLNRELSPIFLLCVASTLLVLLNPENIGSIGFQFSVLTTFGLITMMPPLQEWLGYYITRWLAAILLVPIVAQLWIWPLSVFYFNQFPVHTVPLNILALVLITPLTLIGFTAGVISLIIPILAEWLSLLARPFLDLLLWLVQWGQNMDWAQWSLPSPSGWLLIACYTQLFVVLALFYRLKNWSPSQKALIGLLPTLMILVGLTLDHQHAQTQTTVDLLPLSFKREAYIIHPTKHQAPIALLPAGMSYFEARAVADYLKHRHLTKLSTVLLLPDTEPPTQLRVALRQTQIGSLIHPADVPPSVNLDARLQTYPENGASLKLGSLIVEGRLPSLRIISGNGSKNQHCLLSLEANYQSTSSCVIQTVSEASGTRLFAQDTHLDAQKFYRLVQDGKRLIVY
jgi:competence protein ComEC